MTGQGPDELRRGSEHRSASVPRWVAAPVIAVLVSAGAAAVLHGGGNLRADEAPSPAPTTTPTRMLASVDPLTMITSSDGVCTRTDHRRRVSVSFGVVNLASVPVVVRKVTPVLPLGGLRLTQQSIGLASCGQLQGTQGTMVLTPGRSLVVLFTFALSKQCPAPFPVQAEVTVSRVGGARQVSVTVPVLNDLGGLEFEQC